MKDLIDLENIKQWIKTKWAASLGYILVALAGILIGMVIVEGRVSDDCKFLKTFRFGSQVYNCGRVM